MRRLFRLLTTAAAVALFPAVAVADGSGGDSSPAYSFLDITSSSRIFGLGGVNVSAVDAGVAAVDQNPAFLGPEYDKVLSVGYMRYMSSSDFASAVFGNGVGERSAWGVALKYFGYGSMERTDIAGVASGTFSPLDISLGATYSRDITERLRGGATLRWVYSSYDSYTAMAMGVDLGINYYDPDRDLSLSAVVTNLGGQVKRFNERYDRLPVDVRLGWTQSFPGLPVRFSVTAWNLTKWSLPYYEHGDGTADARPELKDSFGSNLMRHLVLAADLVPDSRFHIGVGYNYKTRTDMATYSRNLLSGFSIGGGLNIGGFGVDAAFAMPHRSAATLMLNFSAEIGRFL